MCEHSRNEDGEVLALVISRGDDEDAGCRLDDRKRRPLAAAQTINTGSRTGTRKRSCGKNSRQTRIAAPARRNTAEGRLGAVHRRTAPMKPNGRRIM